MQYADRIIGADTSAPGGTPGEEYVTAGGTETPGVMCGCCRAATLPKGQNCANLTAGLTAQLVHVVSLLITRQLW